MPQRMESAMSLASEAEMSQARDQVAVAAEMRKKCVASADMSGLADPNLKAHLLLEASCKEPHVYYQFDGFLNSQPDCVFSPDKDGDAIFSGVTPELRSGAIAVRVQILAGTKKKHALRILKKMTQWMEKDAAHWRKIKREAAAITKKEDPLPF